MAGCITSAGKNLMLNRAYSLSPTKTIVSRFKIGASDTAPTVIDTDLNNPVPINTTGVETVDTCDVADWTQSLAGGNEVVNNTYFKEGTGSLELPKDATNITAAWSKAVILRNGTAKDLFLWIRIKDSIALAKLATTSCIEIRYGSDSSNYYYFDIDASALATGWNMLKSAISSMSSFGTPIITALDYIQIRITTNLITDTFTAEDIIMDYWHLVSLDDYFKNILNGGEITLDEVNRRVTIKCFVSSAEANGYLLKEIGILNDDGIPILESHDVYLEISKSEQDEVVFSVTHELT